MIRQMTFNKYSRRKFLGTLPCMALGTTTLYSSLINLKAMNTIAASTSGLEGDYKALVCILLSGGNDSFNMLVPRSYNEYAEYAATRSNQTLARESLLPINVLDGDGREYGLHPSLTRLKGMFESGNLAFISNVGSLVEPVNKESVLNGSAKLPLGLFSHSDQQMHWQTAFPQARSSSGWGGKMADILKDLNTSDEVSMNISLGGNNIFQRGDSITEYAINNDGGVAIQGWNNPEPFLAMMTEDINDMVNRNYEDIFKDSYKGVLKRSIDSNELFNTAIENINPLATVFSDNNLSQNLRMVAQTISARESLGASRQIFFINFGGFDNHDELLNNHSALLEALDIALSEFNSAMLELGVMDCVTTFTISDFARTLTSNGNGTDHAWGGNALVMGGAVNGQKMYGDYPILSLGTSIELGGGVLMPTTSADEYFAELALWFGISPNDLSSILPNIGNFYDSSSTSAPLGFLI